MPRSGPRLSCSALGRAATSGPPNEALDLTERGEHPVSRAITIADRSRVSPG